MTIVRQDVAKLGQGWNSVLLNYAMAVDELDKLAIHDRNSWKFLGAMHGFDPGLWAEEGLLGDDGLVPDDLVNGTYGNQCQHGSWYFLPWHRGYLFAFESIVAAKVKELTGEDWALPYWNYLDTSNPHARRIPDAFLADTLPNGRPNPLKKYPRRPGVVALEPRPNQRFSLSAMDENDFLVGADGSIGFGGGVTGNFIQFASRSGDLETNPHNTVHGLVGGYMGNALLAGLDPLFWLHHCNIDRLWEAWMSAAGKTMVRDADWLDGPADRSFIVPAIGGADPGVAFTARETLREGRLHRIYDDLSAGTGVTPGAAGVARVGMGSREQQTVERIGANAVSAAVRIGSAPVQVRLNVDEPTARAGVAAMGATQPGQKVARLYLALESVRGSAPSPLLDVYVNLPAGADPSQHDDRLAGSLTLFGLNVASQPDGPHGGNGLGYTLDITELAQRLRAAGDFDPGHLRVTLVPGEQVSDAEPVTVGGVSVLQRTGVVS